MKRILALVLACGLMLSAVSSAAGSLLELGASAAELSGAGDVTGDGKLNIGDVSRLYSHVRGKNPLPEENLLSQCDVTGDQRVNIADVAQLYIWVRGDSANAELRAYAKKIQDAQTSTTLTLSLMSDTHYCSHDAAQQDKLDAANKMALLSHYVHVDALANLGDFVAGNEEKDKTLQDLETLMEQTRQNAKAPVFFVRGNHDDNGWYSREEDGYPGTGRPDQIIDHAQWYQLAFGENVGDVVTDRNNPTGGYGYFDHEESKIRVFLLNTSDIPYVLQEDGTYRYHAYECNAFSNAQLNFVANALQFEEKEAPNDWAAMFLMHVPMDTIVESGYRFGLANTPIRGYIQMLSIIDAYKKGISYAFRGNVNATTTDKVTGELVEKPEDFFVSVEADYSAKGCGDVIAFVSGHTHVDNASRKVGYEHSLSAGYTYLSVIGAEAFSTMVVNREEGVVNVFKYGEVRGPSQSKDNQINKNGTILVTNGETEFGIDFSKVNAWTVPFEQIRPQGENLLEGTEVVALDGHSLYASSALVLDRETMLPSDVMEGAGYAISKPILLKQNTQYVIPDIGKSQIYTFHHSLLKYSGTLKPVSLGDQKIITGGSYSGCYVVIVFDKASYPEYENFYIRERVHENVPPNREPNPDAGNQTNPIEGNLFNGMSELWGDGYFLSASATLDFETLELSVADPNSKYAITKAVAVTAGTEYEIADCGSVLVYSYSPNGTFNGKLTLEDGDGCKRFTPTGNRAYVVFCFHKPTYSDYQNFYMKERAS